MMRRFGIIAGMILAVCAVGSGAYGQMMGRGGMMRGETMMRPHGGVSWPDTLESVTVSGTAIVDTTHFHDHYYLDEDGDGVPDDHLSFGPWW